MLGAIVGDFVGSIYEHRGIKHAAYPASGWGGRFYQWASADRRSPYRSFGNGAAMRVSPVGWAFATLEETLAAAAESAAVTHNHPEGIKGAQATAAAIYLARATGDKAVIRREVARRFADERNAVSLGGDADTLACIAGGVAHAYYGHVPEGLAVPALASLPEPLQPVWDEFRSRHAVS